MSWFGPLIAASLSTTGALTISALGAKVILITGGVAAVIVIPAEIVFISALIYKAAKEKESKRINL